MKILVLNGSPRPNGSTKKMVTSFCEGASLHEKQHSRDFR